MKISYENLPCIVMTRISPNCLTETRHGSIQLFCEYILMSKQCVGICEPLINLNCTLEKSDSCIMFLLQTETVSSSTPRLKGSLAKKFPINQNSCKREVQIFFFYLTNEVSLKCSHKEIFHTGAKDRTTRYTVFVHNMLTLGMYGF